MVFYMYHIHIYQVSTKCKLPSSACPVFIIGTAIRFFIYTCGFHEGILVKIPYLKRKVRALASQKDSFVPKGAAALL